MAGLTIFHLEKEEEGVYLLGTNIRDMFNICNNVEERRSVFEFLLKEMMKILAMIDEEKFPKQGVFSSFLNWNSITKGNCLFFEKNDILFFRLILCVTFFQSCCLDSSST